MHAFTHVSVNRPLCFRRHYMGKHPQGKMTMRQGAKWPLVMVFLWQVYHSLAESMPHKIKLALDGIDSKCNSSVASDSDSSSSCNFHRVVGAMRICIESSTPLPDFILNGPGNEPNTKYPKRYLHNMKPVHLWWQYIVHCRAVNQKPAGASTFYRCLRMMFRPYLGFRHKNEMTKCTDCEAMKKDMRDARTIEAKTRVATVYSEHIAKQWLDRQVYWRMRDVSVRWWAGVKENLSTKSDVVKATPLNSWTTVITDGVDQAKFGIPHEGFSRKKKTSLEDKVHKPRLHVTGCWAHGKTLDLAIADADMRKDASSQFDVIARALNSFSEDGVLHTYLFPQGLWMQQDNAPNNCKNTKVFKIAAMLVLKGIFRFVCLAYLVKGHTHEDIDQVFAQILAVLFSKPFATADEVP